MRVDNLIMALAIQRNLLEHFCASTRSIILERNSSFCSGLEIAWRLRSDGWSNSILISFCADIYGISVVWWDVNRD